MTTPDPTPDVQWIDTLDRRAKILKWVQFLTNLFWIEVWPNFSIERCLIADEILHSFDFFGKVHSEIEGEWVSWLRGYILKSWGKNIFFTYQENIARAQVPTNLKSTIDEDMKLSRVICLEDILSHPQKATIFEILKGISAIEKQNRDAVGIQLTWTDIRVHEILDQAA